MLQRQKGNFLPLSDAYSLRSYLYRKEVNEFMFPTYSIKWIAFGRGIGGRTPNKCICNHEMSVANEVASKYDDCQTLKLHFEMRKFLTSKAKMIATSGGDWCRF
ncbi:hypothetical protein [Staphylococcus epidermidis]|uniref:hypothetical protein n=1 Tax=Staphylococcus epidermidis TaxID=1282 RepID=UPI003563E159